MTYKTITKKVIFSIALVFTNYCFCQTIKHNTKIENGFYDQYITKGENSIKKGDSIIIKFPRVGNNYNFITQGTSGAGMILANKKIAVHKIKSFNNTVFIQFKGYGLIPVFIEIENAIETKEIELIN
jgi:hypothetical protein